MPKATIDSTPLRFDLKSCPPDGYIELKRMTYGEWLHRRDMSMMIDFAGQGGSQEMVGGMKLQNEAVTAFEFLKCVVGHNLEDEDGKLLDFAAPGIMDQLDPRVGNEIGQYIEGMHDFEASLKN